MSAKQALLNYLFNDPTREHIDLHIVPGTRIHEFTDEELCQAILESLQRLERGELRAATETEFYYPV